MLFGIFLKKLGATDRLRGVDDDELDSMYKGLKGKLTEEQKRLKERIKTEQKTRSTRNSQKKRGEKGTGTGRK